MSEDTTDLATDSVRGGASLMLGVGITTVVTGLGSILVGRFLGPADYALYSLALVLPTLLFSFSIFGIDVALVRYLPRLRAQGKNEEARVLLESGLVLRIVIAGILALVGFLGSDIFAELILNRTILAPLIRLSSVAVMFESLVWVSFYALQGLGQMSWSGMTRSIHAVLKASLSVGLILVGFGILGGVIGFVSSYIISGTVSLVILIMKSKKLNAARTGSVVRSEMIRRILSFGLPLYIVTIMAVLMTQYRLVLLASFSFDIDIGNFNAAVNIASILTGITAPLLMVLLHAYSKIGLEETRVYWSKAFAAGQRFVSFFIVPSAIVFICFSDEIVFILYGAAYAYTPLYLIWFSGIFLVIALGGGVLESFFIGVGENRLILSFWSLYLLLFLPIGWFMTSVVGTMGLIVAEFLSRIGAYTFGFWRGRKTLGIRIDLRGMASVFLSAGLAGFATIPIAFVVGSSPFIVLIIGLPIYLIVYLTMLPLTRAVRVSDLDLMDNAFSTMRGVGTILGYALMYERFLLRLVDRRSST